MVNTITVRGARVHNLKNVSLEIPRDQLVVVTGLSGSGKSSLAFDTIYAEGQRRYVESLSAYARQFLGQMEKPDVDSIEGLSPAIAIDQKTTSRNPRSTVGTVTEIYDYMRLLFARVGQPHCPVHRIPIAAQTVQQMVDRVLTLPEGTKAMILAPLVRGKKGSHKRVLLNIRKAGFIRARVDGTIFDIATEIPELAKQERHTVEVVVDRIVIKPDLQARVTDSLETALRMGEGKAIVMLMDAEEILRFNQAAACPECDMSLSELSPRLFSFNSPIGACPECDGLGGKEEVEPERVLAHCILHRELEEWPLRKQDAPWLRGLLLYLEADPKSVEDWTEQQREQFFGGIPGPISFVYVDDEGRTVTKKNLIFKGFYHYVASIWAKSTARRIQEKIKACVTLRECDGCGGGRLRQEALAVQVAGSNIYGLTCMTLQELYSFLAELSLPPHQQKVAGVICRELQARLRFLLDVGLEYLTLHRSAVTLSGGEAQRIRLATQVGSALTGVIYVLDEPSIGLHPRDNGRLLDVLCAMRERGNTLLVVEHDEETMQRADFLVDMGPQAGEQGGEVIALGTPDEVQENRASLTGQYLRGARFVALPPQRREPEAWLTLQGACAHNLKGGEFRFPLRTLTCVTGVSGSGKSTLVHGVLSKVMRFLLDDDIPRVGDELPTGAWSGICAACTGWEAVERLVEIDQSPIGRTPRSNPATYIGLFDKIRMLFAEIPEAKTRGYTLSRFSFNVKGGRCEACCGDGLLRIEMHFLPDVYVTCTTCQGKRYNRDTLEIRYRDKNISEVLEMSVEEALGFFHNHRRIRIYLEALTKVGLSYIRLGQSATTLSGGEAQRLKLAAELYRRQRVQGTLYILDEPTTGLHSEDVARLVAVLHELVEQGGSVVVIEHNMDVIKNADYLLDLGPEGGAQGGELVAAGTPDEVALSPNSHTGKCLLPVLERVKEQIARGYTPAPEALRFVGIANGEGDAEGA